MVPDRYIAGISAKSWWLPDPFFLKVFPVFPGRSAVPEPFYLFSGNSEDGVLQIPARLQQQVVQLFETNIKEKEQAAADSADVIRLQLLQLFILLDRNCVQRSRHVPSQKLLLLKKFPAVDRTAFPTGVCRKNTPLLYITP